MSSLEINYLFAFLFGLLIIYLVGKVLYFPLKIIFRLLGNALVGGILLIIFNLIGGIWGLQVGVNLVTALVVGILGIPGVILLVILQSITS